MVDLGQEPNLGRSHGIVVWQEELELEYASLIRRLRRAMYAHVEIPQVILMWDSTYSRYRFRHQSLCLFHNSLWQRHVRRRCVDGPQGRENEAKGSAWFWLILRMCKEQRAGFGADSRLFGQRVAPPAIEIVVGSRLC